MCCGFCIKTYIILLLFYLQAHLAPQSQAKFDFQKYINRSLEEDFKVVVGIRWVISVLTVLRISSRSVNYAPWCMYGRLMTFN